jgi:hypothetical protein
MLRVQNRKDTESCKKCQVTHKGKPIRVTADLSAEILKAKRVQTHVFEALKQYNCQPRLLSPAKSSFKIEGEIKTFHYKHKLKQLMTMKSALQKILKRIENQKKKKNIHKHESLGKN